MILPFSTKLKGKPTYFPEKIITGLTEKEIVTREDIMDGVMHPSNLFKISKVDKANNTITMIIRCNYQFDFTLIHKAKLHTIREDKNDRWKPGTKIDFFINCRQPDMFRFAPVLPVISTQKIEIIHFPLTTIPVRKVPVLKIDGEIIYDAAGINEKQMLEFANNDGFDTIENFFSYFNEDFTGKLIHWTELKY